MCTIRILKNIFNILLAKKMKGKAATVKSKSKPASAFADLWYRQSAHNRPVVSAEQEEDFVIPPRWFGQQRNQSTAQKNYP